MRDGQDQPTKTTEGRLDVHKLPYCKEKVYIRIQPPPDSEESGRSIAGWSDRRSSYSTTTGTERSYGRRSIRREIHAERCSITKRSHDNSQLVILNPGTATRDACEINKNSSLTAKHAFTGRRWSYSLHAENCSILYSTTPEEFQNTGASPGACSSISNPLGCQVSCKPGYFISGVGGRGYSCGSLGEGLTHDNSKVCPCNNLGKNTHQSCENGRGGIQNSHLFEQFLRQRRQSGLLEVKGKNADKVNDISRKQSDGYPSEEGLRPCKHRLSPGRSSIWVTRTSRSEAVADPEETHEEEWAERVSLSDASDHHYQEAARHTPHAGLDPARTGRVKTTKPNVRSRRMMSRPGRRGCCKIIHLKEDNARFILLAIVMVLYMLSGAALFAALERDNELEEKRTYRQHIDNFKSKYPLVNESDLQLLLDVHSQAESAGFVGNKRPRWDFSGAFYFVGTVVSTIGE